MVELFTDGVAMYDTFAVWSVRVDDPSLRHHFGKVSLEIELLHIFQD